MPELVSVTFGAAGTRELEGGAAAYTGSAFGPGGLARVERHRELARGEREARHWHVDHLLAHPAAELAAAWITPGERRECAVHEALPGREVPVGASDCTCRGHLRIHEETERLAAALADVHDERAFDDRSP